MGPYWGAVGPYWGPLRRSLIRKHHLCNVGRLVRSRASVPVRRAASQSSNPPPSAMHRAFGPTQARAALFDRVTRLAPWEAIRQYKLWRHSGFSPEDPCASHATCCAFMCIGRAALQAACVSGMHTRQHVADGAQNSKTVGSTCGMGACGGLHWPCSQPLKAVFSSISICRKEWRDTASLRRATASPQQCLPTNV